MAAKTLLSRCARAPRPAPRSARWRRLKRCTFYALVIAVFMGTRGASVAHATSSSGSGSGVEELQFPSLLDDAGVARVPIAASDAAFVNGTGGSGSGVQTVENDTITFESLLAAETGALIHDESNSTAALVERIPIAEASSGSRDGEIGEIRIDQHKSVELNVPSAQVTSSSAPNMTTSPPPSEKPASTTHTPVAFSPFSSSSSSGETLLADVAAVSSSSPVVEPHGVPSPPTLVVAAAFDSRAEVSWHVPDDDGLDPILEYEVAWIDEIEGKVAGTKVVAPAQGTVIILDASNKTSLNENEQVPTTATITSLVNGRSYAFKVRAKNVNGYSTWSAKSLAVSPLHPPDLCGRVACSGHGTCFPNYQQSERSSDLRMLTELSASSLDGQCICRPGFNPPDCSVKNEDTAFVWTVTEWGECDSGCGGGQRSRAAICWDVKQDKKAASDSLCPEKKPSLTRICNGMECGSKLVSVRYQVETSFDEVLFSPEAWDAFELAFTTEVAAALRIPRTRLEITAIRRGSILVFFQILPASRVGERSLNDIVELLQTELANATSTLRSQGTFARRVETTGVKLSFSIADQTVAGGAEDISIIGLIGTVAVLCAFVALFGLFLRRRHERIEQGKAIELASPGRNVLHAKRSELKPMGIRTMA